MQVNSELVSEFNFKFNLKFFLAALTVGQENAHVYIILILLTVSISIVTQGTSLIRHTIMTTGR